LDGGLDHATLTKPRAHFLLLPRISAALALSSLDTMGGKFPHIGPPRLTQLSVVVVTGRNRLENERISQDLRNITRLLPFGNKERHTLQLPQ
jgi:hypothetical protein